MPGDDGIGSRKRRSNRAVVRGVLLMAIAVLASSWGLAPEAATTIAAVVGFVLVLYGVHVGWLVFYDREPHGPSS